MKILVTGSSGQVASSLVELAPRWPAIELHTAGRPKFDLTDRCSIIKAIESVKPDLVISAAAYTAVDRAEDEPELAHAINVTGAAYVAEAASQVGASVLHLSTDYIFSGEKSHPYDERCPADPRTVYGLTKLKGEEAVARANPRHIILRTSWVYSPFGANFVKTMLWLAATADTVRVVSDQWGNPTSALDIAAGLLRIAPRLRDGCFGVYHFAGAGDTNWSSFAKEIFEISRTNGGPAAEVIEIPTAEYPAKARRPSNSRLCCDKLERTFDIRAPHWRSSTETVVKRLLRADALG
jgi:dTDP-4-dehydrorhamnose reductase